ncbi:MAG: alcohol dehydrogenase catalytic domain-containing protein, partial [Spirochaetota bacterium]
MLAAVFVEKEKILIKEVDYPQCDRGGLILKVKACGICGSDVRNFRMGLRYGITSQIMGHEIAGVVEEVGPECCRFRKGEAIAVAPDVSCGDCYYCKRGMVNLCLNHRMIGTNWPGGFAQYLHLPAEVLKQGIMHPIPSGLSFQAAALSEPLASVIAAQARAGIGVGDTVAIYGDGPVGCLHLEVARARGAAQVVLVGLKRLKAAQIFQPDLLIDAALQDPVAEIVSLTGGIGADVAIIANPQAATQEQGLESVRKRGKVIFFGGVAKDNPYTRLNSNLIHYNELLVFGVFSYPGYMHEKALLV